MCAQHDVHVACVHVSTCAYTHMHMCMCMHMLHMCMHMLHMLHMCMHMLHMCMHMLGWRVNAAQGVVKVVQLKV